MIGIYQTRHNNCVAACVASVFELELSQVPDFDPMTWGEELVEWLLPKGLCFVNIAFAHEYVPQGYSLGTTKAGSAFPPDYKHCVVCKDGKIVWCPKIGTVDGMEMSDEYLIFYPLNPTRLLHE